MSLDDRLRSGLREAAAAVDPDVEAGLAAARRTDRRHRLLRRVALGAAAAAVVALAVPVADRISDDGSVTASPPTDARAERALTGTWITPEVSRSRVTEVLTAAGLDRYADAVAVDQGYPTAWQLRLSTGGYRIASQRGVQVDVGSWRVADDRLVLLPDQCACTVLLAWTLTGDRLDLTLLSDEAPAVDGVPDEAFARALWTAAPFTRYLPASP